MLMFTLCVLVAYIVYKNVEKENVILPIILAFPGILMSVGAFYFGKGQSQPGQVTVTPAETVSEVNTSVSTSSTTPAASGSVLSPDE